MNPLPQTSLVIDPRYVAGIRYQCIFATPAEALRVDRSKALTALFDHVLRDHGAMPEGELPRWDDPHPFRIDRASQAQQLTRLYEALLPHVTERREVVRDGEIEIYDMIFRVPGPATADPETTYSSRVEGGPAFQVPGPATADPETTYSSRFEGGPADGSTSSLPMTEIVRVETYADADVDSLAEYPIVPTVPSRYLFRGYDVLNRQAVYGYLGK